MSAVGQVSNGTPTQRDWPARNHAVVLLGLAWLRAALSNYIASRQTRPQDDAPTTEGHQADSALRGLRAAYEAERAELRESGEPAAIDRLSQLFALSPFDEDCVLLAAAPRLDADFAALFARAHDRPQLIAATPHLAIALLTGGEPEAIRLAFERLSPMAQLRRLRLVEIDESVPSLLAPLETDERMARLIAGEDYADPRVQYLLAPVPAAPCPVKRRGMALALANALRQASRPCALIIGPRGSARTAVTQTAAYELGLGLAKLRLPLLPDRGPARQATLRLLAREAALGSYALLIDADEASARDDATELSRELDAYVLILAREPLEIAAPQLRLTPIEAADRAALWGQMLGPAAAALDGACERLGEQFPVGPAAIARIAGANPLPDETALWASCRDAAGQQLDALAERIIPVS